MLARNIAFKLLHQIDSTELFSDTVLNSDIMETIDIRDRRLVTEIVYGALRRKYNLDHILGISSSRPWHEVESSTKTLLRMSLYQLWFMDRIPDHAVVNDAVEMAKIYIRGNTYRYLNGILRHLARTRPWEEENYARDTPKWIRVSLPRWLWKRWVARYGEAVAEEYAESLNQPPQTALRHFGGLPSDELKHSLRPSELVPNAYIKRTSLEGPALSKLNNFQFQDEASQLIPYLLGNTRGWHIWDACAAPGGKASIFCRMVGDKGRVVASDHSKKRAMYLKDVLDPELFPRALVLVADAGTSAPFNRRYDAVFADVPCSGLGTIRRNPEIKWRFRPSDFSRLQKKQLSILEAVSENVRCGGKLLYSTCSTEPEENEFVVQSFLETHSGFSIEKPENPKGIGSWTGRDGMVRTFPATRGWDGFFAVVLKRAP